MKAPRITNIQALRAVAILLVVCRHLQIYTQRAMHGQALFGDFLAGDMGVDLFFVISGFIMVTTHHEAFTRLGEPAYFLYRRVARIYPLYWFYSLIALAVFLTHPDWLHRLDKGMPMDVVRSFLLWPQPGLPLLGQGWSLVYEMYFYLAFAGMLLLPGKWFLHGLLAWAGVVLAGNSLLAYLPALDWPTARLVCALLTLEFIAGALVGLTVRRTKADRRQAVAGWLAVGLGITWIVGGVLPLEVHLTGGSRLLGYGLPSVALVYGLTTLEKTGRRAPRFITIIGDWSYSIYLSHIFVIAALAHLVSLWPAPGRASEVLLEAVSVAAVLLTGALSYRCLEIPLLRLSRRPWPAWPGQPMSAPAADPS